MDTLTKLNRPGSVKQATDALITDGKNLADAIYDEGVDRVSEVEQTVKEYSDTALRTIQRNPLTSVLISSGIGFLLALFIRK